jgi:N-acetylglucosaminyldiphosphoundecaprenol N-acetyl-beta-D-mannosaminyltransferase
LASPTGRSDPQASPPRAAPERILGVAVDPVDFDQALAILVAAAASDDGPPLYTAAINPEKIMRARRERALAPVLEAAGLRIPDGVGIVVASRLRGGRVRRRVTGIDLTFALAAEAARRGWPVYLLGAAPGVAEAAAEAYRRRYPGFRVAGVGDGYFRGRDREVCVRVRQSGARILLLALGSPAQEYWLHAHLAETGCRIGMGVGGTFDVLAGRTPRAPRIMRRLGLEWLHRLMREPQRYRRMLVLPVFLALALVERRRG